MESLGLTGYKYFQISDNASGPDDFVEVVKYVVGYQKVVVYHGQFESLLAQIPTEQIVTGELPESEAKLVEQASYLFEPSLEVIIGYFESEIMASIFEQTIHESSLSKYASRMINLDRAVVNVQENIKKANYDKQKLRHSMMNKKQLGMLASMSLWTN